MPTLKYLSGCRHNGKLIAAAFAIGAIALRHTFCRRAGTQIRALRRIKRAPQFFALPDRVDAADSFGRYPHATLGAPVAK
jgi:hypothetical protein